MVAESQVKAEVCLEVVEAEDGEEGGEGDGEEAGAGRHHGPGRFRFRFRALLLLSLDSFSFFHPVNVGPRFTCIKEGFVETRIFMLVPNASQPSLVTNGPT